MRKYTVFLIIFVALVITASLYIQTKSEEKVARDGKVIEEVVTFGEYYADKMIPFTVKKTQGLILEIQAKLEKGEISISIISPKGKVVYTKKGQVLSEKANINVTKGLWNCRVICEDKDNPDKYAKNGTYSIYGTFGTNQKSSQ